MENDPLGIVRSAEIENEKLRIAAEAMSNNSSYLVLLVKRLNSAQDIKSITIGYSMIGYENQNIAIHRSSPDYVIISDLIRGRLTNELQRTKEALKTAKKTLREIIDE